jgi:hypothetical protein
MIQLPLTLLYRQPNYNEKQAKAPAAKFPVLHAGRLFLVPTANTNEIIFSEPAPYLEYFQLTSCFIPPNLEAVVGMVSSKKIIRLYRKLNYV